MDSCQCTSQVLSTLGRPVKAPRDMQALRNSTYAKQHSHADGWKPSFHGPWKPSPLPPTGQKPGLELTQVCFAGLFHGSVALAVLKEPMESGLLGPMESEL